jgi:hypothetical protein
MSLRSAPRRWIASSSSEEYPLGRASPPPGMAGAPHLRATQPPPRILAEPLLGLVAAPPQPPPRILAKASPPRSLVAAPLHPTPRILVEASPPLGLVVAPPPPPPRVLAEASLPRSLVTAPPHPTPRILAEASPPWCLVMAPLQPPPRVLAEASPPRGLVAAPPPWGTQPLPRGLGGGALLCIRIIFCNILYYSSYVQFQFAHKVLSVWALHLLNCNKVMWPYLDDPLPPLEDC